MKMLNTIMILLIRNNIANGYGRIWKIYTFACHHGVLMNKFKLSSIFHHFQGHQQSSSTIENLPAQFRTQTFFS